MWNGVDVPMIVSKVTSVEDGGAAPSGDAADTTNAATVLDALPGDSTVSEENEGAQRPTFEARSCARDAVDADNQQQPPPEAADTHSLSAPNGGGGSQGVSTASQLTAAYVQERAAELFPGGTGVPAVKPRQPPDVEKSTAGLAKLVFAASKKVQIIRGVLAREDAAGYLAADLLGIELVGEARGSGRESLKIGESVRKAALAAGNAEAAQRNAASAKRSRMRAAAAKDAVLAARLDSELAKLAADTEAAITELLAAEITLNGLPERNTVVAVKRRRVEPLVPAGLPAARLQELINAHPKEAAIASGMAHVLEHRLNDRFLFEDESSFDDEEVAIRTVRYEYALRALATAAPELQLCVSEQVQGVQARREGTRACPCGAGRLALTPWALHLYELGYCDCLDATVERVDWRDAVVAAGAPDLAW